MNGKTLLLAVLALSSCAAASEHLYERQPSLAGTLVATRSRYQAWMSGQSDACAAVQCGPWSMGGVARPEWKDGSVLLLSQELSPMPVTVSRTLTAKRPVTLAVGLGGGDRIELVLNGKSQATCVTHLEFKRYGTSMRMEGDRRNQMLVALPLMAGENRLELRVSQDSVSQRAPVQFYFSTSPDPVPALWAEVRRDFPPARHPLLEAVPHHWFEAGGWFNPAAGARLEAEFLGLSEAAGGRLEDCVTAAECNALDQGRTRLKLAVEELGRQFGDAYPAGEFLRRIGQVSAAADLERCQREMLVDANPLLRGQSLIFARRHTYDSPHFYDDYYHGLSEWGGNLTVLDLATGSTRDLVPRLNGGIFDRFDLNPDGTRVVFGYRARKPEGFRIWEQGLDGAGLRQLTFPPAGEAERVAEHSAYSGAELLEDPRLYGHWTDDMHPCYLPDGGIAFVSSRPESTAYCGTHIHTMTTLHRMAGDGSELRRLSEGALTESTPTLLEDGRILYTRWEYVYKGIAAVQSLWAMRPDGTGSEEIYGQNIDNPGVFFAGRQVPGKPDLVVCTGCGHEPLAVGSIRLIDRLKDRRSKDAMTSLTPEVETRGLRGLFQFRNGRWVEDVTGSFYCDPYPLSDKFFLVSHNPGKRYNDPQAYGIWLLDAFGNRVLLHQDPAMSCFQPMILGPRPEAPRLPALASQAPDRKADQATVLLADLYRSFPGVKPGTVKYLRVMEQIPRSWVASQTLPGDSVPGQSPAVSLNTHIWVGVLLGIVPVEADGSALFRVPARRNLFFTALDEEFMEVQKMRSFVNFQPGEVRSCVGCHDPRDRSPLPDRPLALLQPARQIRPQPGDSGPRPVHYPSDVQPVLDAHCVSCHGGGKPDGGLDLSGEMTEHFSCSYENLLRKGLVNFIQEWSGPAADKGGPAYVGNGSMMHAAAVPPYTYGSHRSKLVEVLRRDHYGAKLSREEFIRVVSWVDANAPYYGSYFGRRNLAAKGRPDFRPVPGLESACGTPPELCGPPKPMPAELLAAWKSGDLPERFDGRGFVPGKPGGVQEAVSVALWVRPEELGNTWNPLLFTDGAGLSSFHFSLLRDGTPNLAVNAGGNSWVHSRASTAVAKGAWRHVAVVCDGRFGGQARFYIDGRAAGSKRLDLGIPLDLGAYRLGSWKNWEGHPANNFHGSLAEVRLYRGTLTPAEVAALAQAGRPLTAQRKAP